MPITVINLQKKIPINASQIKKQIKIILKKEKRSIENISVVFVGQKIIKQLNKKFLGKSYLTDVLSFDNSSILPKKASSWEIVICADTAIKNAEIYKTSSDLEIKLYLIHGILHLLGFDDNNERNRQIMRLRESKLLKILD